jgi:hypothetical protein
MWSVLDKSEKNPDEVEVTMISKLHKGPSGLNGGGENNWFSILSSAGKTALKRKDK